MKISTFINNNIDVTNDFFSYSVSLKSKKNNVQMVLKLTYKEDVPIGYFDEVVSLKLEEIVSFYRMNIIKNYKILNVLIKVTNDKSKSKH